jgi:hypothetical protein
MAAATDLPVVTQPRCQCCRTVTPWMTFTATVCALRMPCAAAVGAGCWDESSWHSRAHSCDMHLYLISRCQANTYTRKCKHTASKAPGHDQLEYTCWDADTQIMMMPTVSPCVLACSVDRHKQFRGVAAVCTPVAAVPTEPRTQDSGRSSSEKVRNRHL